MNEIKETLQILKEFFDAYKITFWLDYGALFGAYRDGKLISWDKDTDIGIYKDQFSILLVSMHKLSEKGFRIIYTPHLNSLQFIRGETQIDIIVYEKKGPVYECKWGLHLTFLGKILHGIATRLNGLCSKYCKRILVSRIPEKYFNNFAALEFMDTLWPVPWHTKDYLKLHYGKDWRIPKKDYYYADDDGAVVR